MGSIRVAVESTELPLMAALTAFLASQPDLEVRPIGSVDVTVGAWPRLGVPGGSSEDSAILVLGPNDPVSMVDALESGAVGYLPTDASFEDVSDAVRTVADGQAVVPPPMLGALLRHVVRRRRVEREALERLETLTEREREVFDLLAAGHDRSVIAAELFISVGTVRSHLQRVFRKLGVHTHAEVVAFASRCGLTVDSEELS